MTRILLLGRDREMKALVREWRELYRMEVAEEAGAESALRKLAREDAAYDVLILDGEPSGTDIRSFLAAVREHSELPVVLVSDKHAEEDVIQGLDRGVDLYFAKPLHTGSFTAQILALARMRERLQNREKRDAALPEVHGICVDTQCRRVWVRDREKRFTRKEYDLLYFLMSHPGEVFTKEDLYREVWNEEAVGGMATVVMHIRKVRSLVEEKTSEPRIIKTQWGVGYYFATE